jgi:hypothetical protein
MITPLRYSICAPVGFERRLLPAATEIQMYFIERNDEPVHYGHAGCAGRCHFAIPVDSGGMYLLLAR